MYGQVTYSMSELTLTYKNCSTTIASLASIIELASLVIVMEQVYKPHLHLYHKRIYNVWITCNMKVA